MVVATYFSLKFKYPFCMKKISFFLLSCILAGYAQAQTNTKGLSLIDTSKVITVTGDAKLEVQPDFYKVEITLSDAYCKKGETIESLHQKVKDILRAQKISTDSLQLRSMKKSSGYLQDGDIETRTYHLNIRSKDAFDKIAASIDEMQTIQSRVLKTANSNLDQLKEKLYDTAIRDAKRKADVLVKATSQQIDTPISITEKYFDISEPELENSYYFDNAEGMYLLRLTLQVTYKMK